MSILCRQILTLLVLPSLLLDPSFAQGLEGAGRTVSGGIYAPFTSQAIDPYLLSNTELSGQINRRRSFGGLALKKRILLTLAISTVGVVTLAAFQNISAVTPAVPNPETSALRSTHLPSPTVFMSQSAPSEMPPVHIKGSWQESTQDSIRRALTTLYTHSATAKNLLDSATEIVVWEGQRSGLVEWQAHVAKSEDHKQRIVLCLTPEGMATLAYDSTIRKTNDRDQEAAELIGSFALQLAGPVSYPGDMGRAFDVESSDARHYAINRSLKILWEMFDHMGSVRLEIQETIRNQIDQLSRLLPDESPQTVGDYLRQGVRLFYAGSKSFTDLTNTLGYFIFVVWFAAFAIFVGLGIWVYRAGIRQFTTLRHLYRMNRGHPLAPEDVADLELIVPHLRSRYLLRQFEAGFQKLRLNPSVTKNRALDERLLHLQLKIRHRIDERIEVMNPFARAMEFLTDMRNALGFILTVVMRYLGQAFLTMGQWFLRQKDQWAAGWAARSRPRSSRLLAVYEQQYEQAVRLMELHRYSQAQNRFENLVKQTERVITASEKRQKGFILLDEKMAELNIVFTAQNIRDKSNLLAVEIQPLLGQDTDIIRERSKRALEFLSICVLAWSVFSMVHSDPVNNARQTFFVGIAFSALVSVVRPFLMQRIHEEANKREKWVNPSTTSSTPSSESHGFLPPFQEFPLTFISLIASWLLFAVSATEVGYVVFHYSPILYPRIAPLVHQHALHLSIIGLLFAAGLRMVTLPWVMYFYQHEGPRRETPYERNERRLLTSLLGSVGILSLTLSAMAYVHPMPAIPTAGELLNPNQRTLTGSALELRPGEIKQSFPEKPFQQITFRASSLDPEIMVLDAHYIDWKAVEQKRLQAKETVKKNHREQAMRRDEVRRTALELLKKGKIPDDLISVLLFEAPDEFTPAMVKVLCDAIGKDKYVSLNIESGLELIAANSPELLAPHLDQLASMIGPLYPNSFNNHLTLAVLYGWSGTKKWSLNRLSLENALYLLQYAPQTGFQWSLPVFGGQTYHIPVPGHPSESPALVDWSMAPQTELKNKYTSWLIEFFNPYGRYVSKTTSLVSNSGEPERAPFRIVDRPLKRASIIIQGVQWVPVAAPADIIAASRDQQLTDLSFLLESYRVHNLYDINLPMVEPAPALDLVRSIHPTSREWIEHIFHLKGLGTQESLEEFAQRIARFYTFIHQHNTGQRQAWQSAWISNLRPALIEALGRMNDQQLNLFLSELVRDIPSDDLEDFNDPQFMRTILLKGKVILPLFRGFQKVFFAKCGMQSDVPLTWQLLKQSNSTNPSEFAKQLGLLLRDIEFYNKNNSSLNKALTAFWGYAVDHMDANQTHTLMLELFNHGVSLDNGARWIALVQTEPDPQKRERLIRLVRETEESLKKEEKKSNSAAENMQGSLASPASEKIRQAA